MARCLPNKLKAMKMPRATDALAIESLTVMPDRIEAHVRLCDPAARRTTPALIERTLEAFPTIALHTCRNAEGPTFASVMDHTSLPHLLEHLVIDIQTHEQARRSPQERHDDQAVFTGTTQWSAEDPHLAIVRVSFLDDVIALAAFKKALHFINQSINE